ncbi:MFS family permease [Pseudonocardia eucalypti]|uniref:MFS transporter n=1 Tax=Pseudonocardia eucalypti TaxID=648755 RepID=UPI0018378285|nr:MFS family permease [Pseudonocardia eucalypti]
MKTETRRELPRALRPFRHRDYRLLVGSLALSLCASGLWLVAVAWQVIALGGGPAQLSVVATAFSAGLVLAVLLGGVAADRLPHHILLRGVEVARVICATVAGTLAVTGLLQLWQLAVIGFLLGTAEAFFFPAYSALLPTLLPADELLAANGVEGSLRPTAQTAIGPALAGVVVGLYAPGVAFLLAAGIYLVALFALLAMRPVTALPSAEERRSVLHDLGEGFRYLFQTGWLFATLAFAFLYVLVVVGPIEVLLPFAVRDQTGHGAGGYATVLGAFGIGGAVGSLLVSNWRLPRRYLTWMLLCWGLGAVPLAIIGLTGWLWVMVAATFVVGFTSAVAMVIWGTLLQRRVPARLLGRVSSLDFFVSLALMPVSMAIAGPIGEWLGVPLTFIIAGLVPVPLALAAIAFWRLPKDELAHPLDTTPRESASQDPESTLSAHRNADSREPERH